jgi:hypothetical protein
MLKMAKITYNESKKNHCLCNWDDEEEQESSKEEE